MIRRKNTPYHDLSTVESQRNEVIPEEFPEGPSGASTNEDVLGKESPWLLPSTPLPNTRMR